LSRGAFNLSQNIVVKETQQIGIQSYDKSIMGLYTSKEKEDSNQLGRSMFNLSEKPKFPSQ
jgi:hypothetical protein